MVTAAQQLSAVWFTIPVTVERLTGSGAYGPVFDDPVTVYARVKSGRKLVRAADGTEVISEGRISMPADTPLIPEGSYITLPAQWGGRRAQVLVDQLHHGGTAPTPNFYSVDIT